MRVARVYRSQARVRRRFKSIVDLRSCASDPASTDTRSLSSPGLVAYQPCLLRSFTISSGFQRLRDAVATSSATSATSTRTSCILRTNTGAASAKFMTERNNGPSDYLRRGDLSIVKRTKRRHTVIRQSRNQNKCGLKT